METNELGTSASDYEDPEKIHEKIHENLTKSVKLFSYWSRNIETYIEKSGELHKLKQELDVKNTLKEVKELKPETRGSTQEQTDQSLIKGLSEKIIAFNGNDQRQSSVYRRFFEEFKKKRKLASLSLENFKSIEEETINQIIKFIETKLVITREEAESGKEGVLRETFDKNIKILIGDIKFYQETLKSDDVIQTEIDSINEKIEKVTLTIKQIEDLRYNKKKTKKNDSTNFVAAEIGFLIEVQPEGSHVEYYHYPVTFANKNTFSIYDLQNEAFNYVSFQERKSCHNYIVDDAIIKHTTSTGRTQADPSNDYHSESALFFLCQQRSFQEKMINNVIRDLRKRDLKLIKLEKLVLEIHSTNDMCSQCFRKAKYLVNWKKEDKKLIKKNPGNHFLEYFRQAFTKMLKKDKVLDQESELDFKVQIRFSYDEAYSRAETDSHPSIIRFKSDETNFYLLYACRVALSKYSIITSGGVATAHNNYSWAYNKAVESVRIHARNKIALFLKAYCEWENLIMKLNI